MSVGNLHRLPEVVTWNALVGRKAPTEGQLLELCAYLGVDNVDNKCSLLVI
jgi:hypothetical protein